MVIAFSSLMVSVMKPLCSPNCPLGRGVHQTLTGCVFVFESADHSQPLESQCKTLYVERQSQMTGIQQAGANSVCVPWRFGKHIYLVRLSRRAFATASDLEWTCSFS